MLIDGIIIPSLELPPFAAMRRAGLTAATYMSSIWEEPAQALHNISHVRAAIRANSDEAILVRSCSDIAKAEHEGKVGLILGWQNTDGFGSDVGCVPLFHDMGFASSCPCASTTPTPAARAVTSRSMAG